MSSVQIGGYVLASSWQMVDRALTFSYVYETTFSAVWGYLSCRGLSGADREDIVQEVYCVVHQKLAVFEGRSSLKTWVIGITVNVVRDYRRRRATRVLGQDIEYIPEIAANASLPPEQVDARRTMVRLFSLLEGLSEPQREIFLLVEFDQVSVVEAARILEINEETLRSRLRAARRHVNRALLTMR